MASVVIAGNTSGSVTLDAPAVAGTTVLTLPATSGTVIVGSGGVTAVTSGGTGAATLTANNVILGNGTSAVAFVAPGSNGNLLTSNGTTWTSAAAPAGGVTSLNGQSGAITDTTLYAIGSYVIARPANTTSYAVNSTIAGSSLQASSSSSFYRTTDLTSFGFYDPYAGASVVTGSDNVGTGTWRCMSRAYGNGTNVGAQGLWVRIS
jgi:hypothetical protein